MEIFYSVTFISVRVYRDYIQARNSPIEGSFQNLLEHENIKDFDYLRFEAFVPLFVGKCCHFYQKKIGESKNRREIENEKQRTMVKSIFGEIDITDGDSLRFSEKNIFF